MNMIKAILLLIVIWHGLMFGCCVITCKNDFISIRAIAKAVILHDVKFLTANCNYKKTRIIFTILFVAIALIGSIIPDIIF